MASAPTNIRTTRTDVDGWVVCVEWDDPNGASTASVFIYNSTGQWQQFLTSSVALKRAYVPGGSSLMLMLKDQWGGSSAKVPFTADAATQPAPPAPVETAREKLEDVVGPLQDGDKVAVYPSPSTVLTVNADGTVA